MKFFDSFKLAFHNIINNKSRSILTIIIVMVVSTLIMGITAFGIVFVNNVNEATQIVFDEKGTSYRLNPKVNGDYEHQSFLAGEIEKLDELADKYESIIDTVKLDSYVNASSNDNFLNMTFINTKHYNINFDNFILEGRIWNKNDVNKNNIWISSTQIKYFAKQDIYYNVGDKFPVQYRISSNNNGEYKEEIVDASYDICGIFDSSVFISDNSYYNDLPNIILDYHQLLNDNKFTNINGISMTYTPPKADYNFKEVYKLMKEFDVEMKSVYGKNSYGSGYQSDRFYCEFVNEMKMNEIMGLIIQGVLILLAFIVLLLSIGSVANTIVISVDKNRRFIGLMKALGLNEKGVKRMVSLEAFLTVLFGIILSTIILYFGVKPVLLVAIEKLMSSMFGYYHIEFQAFVNIPVLVPVVTLIVFYFMTLLFSKGSLVKIASQDVIDTISEVA